MAKRLRVISIFIVIIFLIGAGFFFFHKKQAPIKLGFSAGLLGLKSELGVSGRNGVELAVEEINLAGGIKNQKLELVVANDGNNSLAALEADRQLMQMGAKVIIGHMVSGVGKSTVKYANEKQFLLVSPTIATEELTGYDDNFIRIIASNSIQGKSLALAALQETGVARVAVVYDINNESFAKPIIQSFKQNTSGSRLLILDEMSFSGQYEFGKIIDRLRVDEAEGVLLIASSLDSGMFCQQLRKKSLHLQVFAPMWTMTNDFLQAGGEDGEGTYFVSQVDLNNQTQYYLRFRENYKNRFGEEPTFASILSYDAAKIAAFGIEEAGNDSAKKIKAAILSRGNFEGLQGQINLDAFGDMQCDYYLYRVQSGIFQKVRKL